jgi:hypothetical protein
MTQELNQQIVQVYSKIHTPIIYTNGPEVSFQGSQIQQEFFEAWRCISKYFDKNKSDHITFLEVGAWRGLWGIAFCEFCKLQNIRGTYLTVTMIDQDPGGNIPLYQTLEYMNSQEGIQADLIDTNTLSENALPEVLKYRESFNIVFIDADHSYSSVMSDIRKFANLADDILLFHDIRPLEVVANFGVYQAIVDSNLQIDTEIVTNENLMGIGIIYTQSTRQ